MLFSRKNRAVEQDGRYSLCISKSEEDSTVYFELNYSGETGDEGFRGLAVDLMEAVLREFQVYTVITSHLSDSCYYGSRKCENIRHFPELYFRFLQGHQISGQATFNKEEQQLVTESCGINRNLLATFLAEGADDVHNCSCELYGLPAHFAQLPDFALFQQFWNHTPCTIFMEYQEMQDHLSIHCKDDQALSRCILHHAREVCGKYGKELRTMLYSHERKRYLDSAEPFGCGD